MGRDSLVSAGMAHGWIEITEEDANDNFDIELFRTGNGFFDAANFSSVAESRGYILVHYDNS